MRYLRRATLERAAVARRRFPRYAFRAMSVPYCRRAHLVKAVSPPSSICAPKPFEPGESFHFRTPSGAILDDL